MVYFSEWRTVFNFWRNTFENPSHPDS